MLLCKELRGFISITQAKWGLVNSTSSEHDAYAILETNFITTNKCALQKVTLSDMQCRTINQYYLYEMIPGIPLENN